MTQTQQKRTGGTTQIVFGAVLLAFAVVGFVRLPVMFEEGGATLAGALVGTVGALAIGVLLLVLGLNRRRAN